jgi:hypothetical protein
MLSVKTILAILIVVIFIVGVVLLVLYYRDDDENKSSGLKIAGWILASPGLFFLAIGLIYVFFSR